VASASTEGWPLSFAAWTMTRCRAISFGNIMLLILAAPNQLCGWVGREHGGSIP
jgi:hypothetical protein